MWQRALMKKAHSFVSLFFEVQNRFPQLEEKLQQHRAEKLVLNYPFLPLNCRFSYSLIFVAF